MHSLRNKSDNWNTMFLRQHQRAVQPSGESKLGMVTESLAFCRPRGELTWEIAIHLCNEGWNMCQICDVLEFKVCLELKQKESRWTAAEVEEVEPYFNRKADQKTQLCPRAHARQKMYCTSGQF